jgi:hypothetical protein
VLIEGNASPSIIGGRMGIAVKVTGNNLVIGVAQNAF